MAFFSQGTGKPFLSDPEGAAVHFFGENWVIYKETRYDPGNTPVLWGQDRGNVSLANSTYRMNGTVAGAKSPFTMRTGRRVHMEGLIIWAFPGGPPETSPGLFRLH